LKVTAMKTLAAVASLPLVFVLCAPATAQTSKPGSSTPSRTSTTVSKPRTPAPVGTTGTSTAATTADYRLVPGDKLSIQVYRDQQLSQQLQIRPDGKITMPLLGDVVAAGKTSLELRDTLTTSLKEYIELPVVTVIVTETVPPVVYVMGEVNAPGPQAINGQLSVLQALAAAGGFKDFAKTKDIRILRKTATGTTTLKFNYKDALNGEKAAMYLQPGDTVIVP
jgi:polysaccharide export outer membrane protein